jgi:hypothetical protein
MTDRCDTGGSFDAECLMIPRHPTLGTFILTDLKKSIFCQQSSIIVYVDHRAKSYMNCKKDKWAYMLFNCPHHI